jgi:4-hydroxy-tetrahydrodipicolinate reductase
MPIKILVNGATGKMGSITVETLQNTPDFQVVGQTGRYDNLATAIATSGAQVVVDFSIATAALTSIETIIAAGAHPVVGTSGLLKNQIVQLQAQCEKLQLGGLIAPNFSLGAVLMMKQAQELAKYFPAIEIIEMHHDRKLDSPSGTAMRAAEMLNAKRQIFHPNLVRRAEHEVVPGSRGAFYQDINIHAIRLPGTLAHLQIIFGSNGETVTFRHDSLNRECFMPGVVLACKKVLGLKSLVYGLENILD